MPSCEICGSTEFHPIWVAQHYIGYQAPPEICQNCGFIQVQNRRSSAEIAADWKRIYEQKIYDPNWPGVKARLYYVAEWIEQNVGLEGKLGLDIGGGAGAFTSLCNDRGANFTFFDPAYGSAVVEEFEPLVKSDIVTILWTLENCGDCNAMIAKARECLKPDGHLVVATGSRILVPFRKPMSAYFSKEPQDLHAFRWSAMSLAAILTKHGFKLPTFNDFGQNDVLLVSARPTENKIVTNAEDDPAAVENHFIDWYRSFP